MSALVYLSKMRLFIEQHFAGSSLGVALVAFSCAFLVQTKQLDLNYAYPVEVLLKTILTDDILINSHCTK